MHTLSSTSWRLWLDPARGVQWCGLAVRKDDEWLHLMPDCLDGEASGPHSGLLDAACFTLLPYSNRIRDAQFSFEGKTIQLDGAERHAMHGALRKLPWQVESATDTQLTCHFDSSAHERQGHPPINWPWPISASNVHTLEAETLTSTLSLTNRGQTPMPAGLGWHPYFLNRVGGSPVYLTLPVERVFPDANGDCLPDGPAVNLPANLDFRTERAIDDAQRIDHCFAGLNGDVHIRWPDAGIGLRVRASDLCRFAVLYNPDAPYFAVEPVSNANDAFNLQERGVDAGRRTLAPGETLSAQIRVELEH